MRLSSVLFSFCAILPFITLQQASATTTEELQEIIECKTNAHHYREFTGDYEEQLQKLGWKRKEDPEQPLLYIYQHKNPIQLFNKPTKEIGLTGNAVVAIYRDTSVQTLSKQFGISQIPEFKMLPVFRGEKLIATEPATEDSFTTYKKLVLSELKGKSTLVVLGCSYEPDRKEMEKMLELAEAE